MPMSNFDIEIKKNRRRQARILALYLTIKAWVHDLECIVVSRDDLIKFFGFDEVPWECQIISELARFASGLEAPVLKP